MVIRELQFSKDGIFYLSRFTYFFMEYVFQFLCLQYVELKV